MSENRFLQSTNTALTALSAEERLQWAFNHYQSPIVTTSFGNRSAALLHLVTMIEPQAKIVWIDTGYNTIATYRFAETLIEQLELNINIYSPEMTSIRRTALMGGIPNVEDPHHEEFTRQVKLEPFRKAIDSLRPNLWISGIRAEQSAHRKHLSIISRTVHGTLKLSPLLDWSDAKMEDYIQRHDLPNEKDYFDPTKVLEKRECGLHTRI